MSMINKFMFLVYVKLFNIPGPEPLLQLLEAAACGREEIAGRRSARPRLNSWRGLGMSWSAPA